MTRIVGGRWSGRRVTTPAGEATRPTSERVREAIVNSLAARGAIDGARALDLYAGTGAMGLELASRGAASVVLVEHAPSAQMAIRATLASLAAECVTLVRQSALTYAAVPGDAFDIVLADPPYAEPDAAVRDVLIALAAAGRLRPGADIVLERSARRGDFEWPDPFVGERVRRYGDTVVCYGRAS